MVFPFYEAPLNTSECNATCNRSGNVALCVIAAH